MRTAIVLFTRDLRLNDNPTLHAALRDADRVVPLFVLDSAVTSSAFNSPNRALFLSGALHDLDAGLKRLGAGGLVVRRGDLGAEVRDVLKESSAVSLHVSTDWSGYARRREQTLRECLEEHGGELHVHPETVAVCPPGVLTPQDRDHFAVFTPFHRQWEAQTPREVLPKPRAVEAARVTKGRVPTAEDVCAGDTAPHLPEPGETAGRELLNAWLRTGLKHYADRNDDMAADETSRLSPYLHFGCLSPLEVRARAEEAPGGAAFVRQLAWRDFYLQVLAARPDASRVDYRTRSDRWRRNEKDFEAWKAGRTGIPIVDAGMRQLLDEGWMHNRARLIVGSFLTKHLYLDWRRGAAHFMAHLVDGDVANNQLNWQWIAGTGTDTRPNRVLNPLRQAERFDPDGDYVRRWVPELRGVEGAAVHQPWDLDHRDTLDYPEPIVELSEGRDRFLAARHTR